MGKSLLLEHTSSEDLLQQIGLLIDEKVKALLPNSLKNSEEEEVLTIDQTAELLGVSRTSLYNYEKLGLLKPSRIGKTTRYLKSDVINCFKNQQ